MSELILCTTLVLGIPGHLYRCDWYHKYVIANNIAILDVFLATPT